jgi:predicted Zn-dependent peptidase
MSWAFGGQQLFTFSGHGENGAWLYDLAPGCGIWAPRPLSLAADAWCKVPAMRLKSSAPLSSRLRVLGAAAALVATVLWAPAARADDVSIPFTTSKLPNGMTVILHEDHSLPIVAVNITYKVGSRFEAPRRTGFAHLFEHLMFMGTQRAPTKMFDAWMEAAGGWNNADTSEDRTEFYDVAPPTALPLLLWLEADRQRDLGPLMTQEKLEAQRDIVRNERRQTTENQPYGVVELRLPELLFPDGHPYHHPVIGSHQDLEAATVADVQAFFAQWYDPANASLVVAGDFDPAEVKADITRLFGPNASHGAPVDPGVPAAVAPAGDASTTLTKVVRETVTDRVELPKIVMAWQSPKRFAPGDADLDLLASVLAVGKASRLYQSLVYQQKLAQGVEAVQETGAVGSRFVVSVMARPDVALDKLEAAIDKELDRLRKTKVTDEELRRAENGVETVFVSRLQSVRARASLLNDYQTELGDPGYAQKDLDRYRKATAADLLATAQRVLLPNARVVLRVVPVAAETPAAAAKQGAPK